jgi:type III restriction enzyme
MSQDFFEQPILNSPYQYPQRHWELDKDGQPTHKVVERRRVASFITPIPKPKKRKQADAKQAAMVFDEGKGLSDEELSYDTTSMINEVRVRVDNWRKQEDPATWNVTPQTQRLLQHWRHYQFNSIRPFFCQVEAVETLIWLIEVAPKLGAEGRRFIEHFNAASLDANPELLRLALKLATGAGKTTVMAMIIAWQTINAIHHPRDARFTQGFLIVTPGLTIRDRLRVLLPNDPDSYYAQRELVPVDLLPDLHRAKIVITNYHAFGLRERVDISKGTRNLLIGRSEYTKEGLEKLKELGINPDDDPLKTRETPGQMIQRVMPELMGLKRVMVINDEAHHCYRERPNTHDIADLKGEEKEEAKLNNEAARLWISGLEYVKQQIGINRVVDLSATPFFLRGSGYAEGTLFPWTLSDFSLMDAIECGIVKLPRVPVADNISTKEMPMYRNLWENIGKDMPKKGRAKGAQLDPLSLPTPLLTALEALYGHYEKTFAEWEKNKLEVPPCFIIVCNNTATSKLVYDYVSGFKRTLENGDEQLERGRLRLFDNFDNNGNPLPRPNTLLIDSQQLESGEALDENFRKMAADEIERFKRDIIERTGNADEAAQLSDADLLREVMNTVGKPDRLGAQIRCVVSVSMLTEGWDANTVTHILGVRAFGTQLLCEQVIGRALRRQSYDLNEHGLFSAEYADIFGIPFDFTAQPVISKPQAPKATLNVKALPEREALEIRFPRVVGYNFELPERRLKADFDENSYFELTPEIVGATLTNNAAIIGEEANFTLEHLKSTRVSTIIYELSYYLLGNKLRESNGSLPLQLFGQVKQIVREWLDKYLICKGDTYPAQLVYRALADQACEKIFAAISRYLERTAENDEEYSLRALIDNYNPIGSTRHVNFQTSKPNYWKTNPRRSHINYVICDSNWEEKLCQVVERHPKVIAYAKNHGLNFEIPYSYQGKQHTYLPDFIVLVDDGHGTEDPLHLIVEVKGQRDEADKAKADTMTSRWIPGVNRLKNYGRWKFLEVRDLFEMDQDFERELHERITSKIAAFAE